MAELQSEQSSGLPLAEIRRGKIKNTLKFLWNVF